MWIVFDSPCLHGRLPTHCAVSLQQARRPIAVRGRGLWFLAPLELLPSAMLACETEWFRHQVGAASTLHPPLKQPQPQSGWTRCLGQRRRPQQGSRYEYPGVQPADAQTRQQPCGARQHQGLQEWPITRTRMSIAHHPSMAAEGLDEREEREQSDSQTDRLSWTHAPGRPSSSRPRICGRKGGSDSNSSNPSRLPGPLIQGARQRPLRSRPCLNQPLMQLATQSSVLQIPLACSCTLCCSLAAAGPAL